MEEKRYKEIAREAFSVMDGNVGEVAAGTRGDARMFGVDGERSSSCTRRI